MRLNVLLISNQVRGIDGAGGLGDVAAALPKALARRGDIDVRVLTPGFSRVSGKGVEDRFEGRLATFDIPFGNGSLAMEAYRYALPRLTEEEPEVPCYLLRAPVFDEPDRDSADKAVALCRGAVEFMRRGADFHVDLVHCNDWHTGLVPVYLKTLYAADPYLGRVATLYTVHNLRLQGWFAYWQHLFYLSGLPGELYHPGATRSVEHGGGFNFTKGGLAFADLLNTVSATYARELLTPDFGEGFEGLLAERSADLAGIVNGIDTAEWDPLTDAALKPHNYGRDAPWGKVEEKKKEVRRLLRAWQAPDGSRPFGKLDPDADLVGLVSRISEQKVPAMLPALEGLCDIEGSQLAVLGDAHPQDVQGQEFADAFAETATERPADLLFYRGYDEPLSHLIYAACDLFLVPSTYEPCGLTQMIAMRYGSVPVVRAVGGLADTVVDAQHGARADGFAYAPQAPFPVTAAEFALEAGRLLETVKWALGIKHGQTERWAQLVGGGMARDSSWGVPAAQYARLYGEAVGRRMRSSLFVGGDAAP